MKENVFFVSGIDTNIGKSYATGFLAREWNKAGIRTITQKLIQTGNTDSSEDIELHRRIMGTGMLLEDRERLTMPEIYTYPCSPHLAEEIDHRPIDFARIEEATKELSRRFDTVLLEGAGRPDGSPHTQPADHRLRGTARLPPHPRHVRATG